MLLRARAEFGDVVRFRYFGPFAWHFFAHPTDVELILVTRYRDFPKWVFGRVLALVLPNGLVSTDDAVWARQRRLVQPGFHASVLAQFVETIVLTAETHLAEWVRLHENQAFDLKEALPRLTFDVAGRTLLGSDLADGMGVIHHYASVALAQLNYRLLNPLSPLPFLPVPTTLRYRAAARRADTIIETVIAQRRAERGQATDLLAMLIEASDDGQGRSTDGEVRDLAKALLLSGYETASTTLAWFWHELVDKPEVERRVRDEILTVVGDRRPRVEDLPALTYTTQVLNETLRLWPAVPWLGRQARHGCDVNGYRLGRRAVICVSPYVTHRHPEFWADPDTFDPNHFAPDAVRQRPRAAFFPFGVGPRHCVGQSLAMMEMLLVIAVVLPKWRLRPAPGAVVVPHLRGTLQPWPTLPMVLEPATSVGQPVASVGLR